MSVNIPLPLLPSTTESPDLFWCLAVIQRILVLDDDFMTDSACACVCGCACVMGRFSQLGCQSRPVAIGVIRGESAKSSGSFPLLSNSANKLNRFIAQIAFGHSTACAFPPADEEKCFSQSRSVVRRRTTE